MRALLIVTVAIPLWLLCDWQASAAFKPFARYLLDEGRSAMAKVEAWPLVEAALWPR